MAFLYFAYGSNLWPPQLCSRCGSARVVGPGVLPGWKAVYDKPGADGSAKLNLREDDSTETHGVVYVIDDDHRTALDLAEPGYEPFTVRVTMRDSTRVEALTYRWVARGTDEQPSDWYVALAVRGARHHDLPAGYIAESLRTDSVGDPIAPGLRPAGVDDLTAMQRALSAGLAAATDRYTIHPGDLAWWMWHDDPRYPGSVSYWLRDDDGVLVVDARSSEIVACAAPGRSVVPMIEWAQRRLGGVGEVGWVSDSDEEMMSYLQDNRYNVTHSGRLYHWDLEKGDVPEVALPGGWQIRGVQGEHEADARRHASHSAFRSTMDPEMHLQRYLKFMRSPVYDRTRDLVAVAPDGRIASFMIWWPDETGIAQIEPFGTHPDFQRLGVGRALIQHGLRMMRDAGMTLARVTTDDYRADATGFYESVGFADAGRIRWWRPGPHR